MKKVLLAIVFLLIITLPVSAQDYWVMKTDLNGIMTFPSDDNGTAFGAGARVSFGQPDGSFDIGFEVGKWWRSFDQGDSLTGYLISDGQYDYLADSSGNLPLDSLLDRDQQALQFSVFIKHKFFSLFSNSMDVYSGVGGGFYFLREERQESRQNPITGFWEVVKVDNYLDTKGQSFFMLGFNGSLSTKFDLYVEGRYTYIFDWNRWDNPYEFGALAGLKYNF